MKEKIQEALDKLIGLTLTRTTRAANMECLKFGHEFETDAGDKQINIGQFGLHLQCAWRITQGQKILIGCNDVYEQSDPAAKYDPDFDWDGTINLRDKKMRELIGSYLTVEKIATDDFRGFSIYFNGDIVLTTFPITSLNDEYWRLLDNRPATNSHFVVGGDGVWESVKR
jgi:hypothetical protein